MVSNYCTILVSRARSSALREKFNLCNPQPSTVNEWWIKSQLIVCEEEGVIQVRIAIAATNYPFLLQQTGLISLALAWISKCVVDL